MQNVATAPKTDAFRVSINAGDFPFTVTTDNDELIKEVVLSRLRKELELGKCDKVEHTENEIYELLL